MLIPRSYVEAYSRSLNDVSDRGRAALEEALAKVDFTQDVASIREQVISIMQACCGASATMSARLAAEFYDGLRAEFGIDDGYQAVVEPLVEPEATEGAVRAFVQDLVDEKPVDQFIGKCSDRLDYESRKSANKCIERNVNRDPRKPKWARVPTGPETCEFCIMLASRGFVYGNEDLASHAHAHCDCRVVPSWDKKKAAVEGYDPSLYLDRYLDQCRGRAEEHSSEMELRRTRFEKSDGSEESYELIIGSYIRSLSKDGRIDARFGAIPKGKELVSAKRLAEDGHTIVFLPETEENGIKNIDILLDDLLYELKIPDPPPKGQTVSSDPLRYIENNLKKAKKQFKSPHYDATGTTIVRGGPIRVIFDSRLRDGDDPAIRHKLAIKKNERGIDEILFVSHTGTIEHV